MTCPAIERFKEAEKQFIEKVKAEGDIATTDSGHYAYFAGNNGYLTAYNLRVIADELDRLNSPLDDSIAEYFRGFGK